MPGKDGEREARKGETPKDPKKRMLLKTLATIAAASALAPLAGAAAAAKPATAEAEGTYYEYFYIDNNPELIEEFEAYGLVLEVNGRKCVANPLLPDRCMAYVKPYQQDRFAFRPPGSTKDFEERCIRCGLCYFQCHMEGYGAIRLL